jgi:hypothetical protein
MPNDSRGDASAKTLAILGAAFAGLFVGGASVFVQRWYAPFGVFPLLVGMSAGATAVLPLLLVRPRGFPFAVSIALMAAAGCCIAQHYGTFIVARREMFRDAQAVAEARRHIEGELAAKGMAIDTPDPRPISLGEYFDYQWNVGRPLGETRIGGAMLAAWWTLDAILVWLGASLVTASFTTPRGAKVDGKEESSVPAEPSAPNSATPDSAKSET